MANRNREYDPNQLQDRTGMVFEAKGHKSDSGWKDLFVGQPFAFKCWECGRPDRFRVLVDTDPDSGLFMLGCQCGMWSKPFELHMPKVRDGIAKKLGLYVPDDEYRKNLMVPVEIEVDIPND